MTASNKSLISTCLLGQAVRYNDSFNVKLTNGLGVTAALLRPNGVSVFSEYAIEKAEQYYTTGM